MRIYGVAIRDYSDKLVDFVKTNNLSEAKRMVMAVDTNLSHSLFYSKTGYIMEKTYNRIKKQRN